MDGDDPDQEDGLMAMITFDMNATGALGALGFRRCVGDFLDAVMEGRQPVSSGREAARTQLQLDRILASAGLPQDEVTGREWTSHAR